MTGWPTGVATGVGSMPGTVPREAAALVLGELPDLPHLVELPARGPGADLVGRAAALLVDLHVDRQPSGWRLVDRAGLDERRARSWLDEDLDALEEVAQDFTGPLKVQVAGPWTLAAQVELPRGDKALADPGATREVAESLGAALAGHVADVARRVPGAQVLVQLDEPSLPAVLTGTVSRASGWGRLEPVEAHVVEQALAAVVLAAGVPVGVHCCAADVPTGLLRRAGASMVGLDAAVLGDRDEDALGEAIEAGTVLGIGLVPTRGDLPDPAASVVPLRRLGARLGLGAEVLSRSVLLTPGCGLAGVGPGHARAVLARAREAARRLVEDAQG